MLYEGGTLNFESTCHSGEWPSKCTRPDQLSLTQTFPPPPHCVFPTILVMFYFYFWMTIEIYFNTDGLLTSTTVNRKFQILSTAVLLPVDTACAFLKSNLSSLVCCLSSCCRARFAGFFSGHKLTLWHCFARRWAALFSWYDMRVCSITSAAIDKSGRVFNHGRPTCHFVENILVLDSDFSYSFDWSQVVFGSFSFFFSSTTLETPEIYFHIF